MDAALGRRFFLPTSFEIFQGRKKSLATTTGFENNRNKNSSHLRQSQHIGPAPASAARGDQANEIQLAPCPTKLVGRRLKPCPGKQITMIVCICHNVSDKAIRAALANGATSMQEIRTLLNVGSCCGKCASFAKTLVRAHLEDTRITEVQRIVAA